MARTKSAKTASKSSAALGFEAKLWLTAASKSDQTRRFVDLPGGMYEFVLRPTRLSFGSAFIGLHVSRLMQIGQAR